MPEPPSYSDVRKRLGALHDRGDVPTDVSPMTAASPGQLDAMNESMAILSDPVMMGRVRDGRQAVMRGDLIALADVPGVPAADAPGQFSVDVTGPVVRELSEAGEESAATIVQMLAGLTAAPAEQGRPLGMGLVGVFSMRGETHRLLYAVHRARRLVTVLSVDGDAGTG